MKYICIWLIRLYRKFLSPLKRKPCCRFVPTCSAYAIEAFQKRGFFVGMILTISRVLRCNPYCEGGYDPVPEKGLRYKGSREIPMPDDVPDNVDDDVDDENSEGGDNDCCEDGSICGFEEPTEPIASTREVEGEDETPPKETSVQGKEKNQ